MFRQRPALAVRPRTGYRPALLALEDRTAPAKLALFFDNAFVDTASPPPGNEAVEIRDALLSQGHTVTTFTGVSALGFANALADQDALVIPELENGDLALALSGAARTVIANFVKGGGGLIIAGDAGTNDTSFLNAVFGFGLAGGTTTPGTSTVNAANALGTPFAGGPATLPQNNATSTLTIAGLPATGRSIYTAGTDSTVAIIGVGGGNIAYLGWDWFDALPAPGSQDGGWNNVLGRAVQFAPRAPATLVWTGDVNASWGASSAGNTNWSGDQLPRDGDSLLFPLIAGNRTNTNNITGLDLNALTFGGVDYVITGNAISVAGGINDGSSAGANAFNPDITLATSQTFNVTVASTTLSLGGALSGTADVSKAGAGTLQFTGSANKVFNGTTRILNGVLLLSTATGDSGISANIVVGDDVGAANGAVLRLPNTFQVPDAATVTVLSDGLVNLPNSGTFEDIFNLNLGSAAGGGNVTIAAGSTFQINQIGGVEGTVTTAASPTSSTIAGGSFDLEGTTTFTVANGTAADDLVVSSVIANAAANGAGVTMAGPGRMLLNAAATYPGTTTVSDGTLTAGTLFAIPTSTPLAVNGTGIFDLNAGDQSVASLTGNGTVTNSSGIQATLSVSGVADSQFDGVLTGKLDFIKTASSTLTLAGASPSTYSGLTEVLGGALILDKPNGVAAVSANIQLSAELRLAADEQIPDSASVSIAPGGLFALNGRTETLKRLDFGGGSLDAGPRSGLLRVTDVGSTGGTWNVAVNGTVPGQTYDQIIAINSVDLTGVILNVTFGFTPHVGDTFTLVDNQGGAPVTGTFAGIADNALTSFGGHVVRVNYTGANGNSDDVVLTYIHGPHIIVTAQDRGPATVRVLDAAHREEANSFLAFPGTFRGGVRVAVGDVNGDGVLDIVCAPGAGGTVLNGAVGIRVFDGATGLPLAGVLGSGFNPFGSKFTLGFWVAAADFNGDGHADIAVGPNTGLSPEVKVISGADGTTVLADLKNLFPNTLAFKKGVRLATGDFDADLVPDLVLQAGSGAAARVRVVRGTDFQPLAGTLGAGFNPFADVKTVAGPLYVTAGDVDGDGTADLIVSARLGTRLVRIFDETGTKTTEFVGPSAGFGAGFTVAALDADGDGHADVVIGAGRSLKLRPEIRIVDPETGIQLDDVSAFDGSFLGGVFVAAS